MNAPKARRSFLAGLSAALTAPAAVALAAPVAQAATLELQESPELVMIGEKLSTLLDAYRGATARKVEAVEHFERTRPTVPAELVRSPQERRYGDLCWPETNIDGEDVYLSEDGYQRYIFRWKNVQSHVILREISPRTREGKWLRKIARLAKKHERHTAAARVQSGYDDLSREAQLVALKIDELARRLHTETELTPRGSKGLVIYAEALTAIADCFESGDARGLGHQARLGSILAGSLLRLQGDQAADGRRA